MSDTNIPAENPRAVIGSNRPPDFAERIGAQIADDYAELASTASLSLEKARSLPETVEDEDTLEKYSSSIVDMRDTAARAEANRKMEKEPFWRAGQAVDGFFNGIQERLNKTIGILQKRVHAYNERKLAAERERRRLEAEETARIAREKQEAEDRTRAAAEEARLAAERARKPELIEQKSAVATQQEQAAAGARVDAVVANEKAQDARIETLRKPSEMVRSRFDEGRLVTMRQVGYVEILDKAKLDKEKLWPFLKDDDVLKALKAWAKTTSHKQAMDGAIVEMRDDTVIR
jgi:hypothetical protein